MAISVDSVYKTVQRVLNVEQRGQLPPEDFNQFAKLAQDELFNNLFADRAHFMRSQKSNMELMVELQNKIDVFIDNTELTSIQVVDPNDNTMMIDTNQFTLPADEDGNNITYDIGTVYYTGGTQQVIVEKINHKKSQYIMSSKLTRPSNLYPKYLRFNGAAKGVGRITVFPETITSGVRADYIRRPSDPRWGYLQLGSSSNAVYSDARSNDFDLHPSMEDDLVMKILYYSAISIKQDDVAQYADRSISQDQQIDKS